MKLRELQAVYTRGVEDGCVTIHTPTNAHFYVGADDFAAFPEVFWDAEVTEIECHSTTTQDWLSIQCESAVERPEVVKPMQEVIDEFFDALDEFEKALRRRY